MPSRLLVVAFATACACVANAATFTVTNPTEFQTALTTAQSNGEADTINVAAGTYTITSTLTYVAAAGENFELEILPEPMVPSTPILDGSGNTQILSIDVSTVTADVFISGLLFQNGDASGATPDGGALAIDSAGGLLEVFDSEFFANTAEMSGGALWIRSQGIETPVEIYNNTFDGNTAGTGGAIYVQAGAGQLVDFYDNDVFRSTATARGGGLLVEGVDAGRVAAVDLFDNLFFDNVASEGGGADIASAFVSIDSTGFVDNVVNGDGGGLLIRDMGFGGEFRMINTGFTGNQASNGSGGGLFTDATRDGFDFGMTNNTFVNNLANTRGGGAYIQWGGSTPRTRIYNNIIWNNFLGSIGGTADDFFVDNDPFSDIASTVEVFNNDVTAFAVNVTSGGELTQGNNVDIDPDLVDLTLRPEPDPRLNSTSPMIDMGDNNAPGLMFVMFDFEGEDRIFNSIVDIGMDEFSGAVATDADLSVTKSDDQDPVTEGGNITYTVTVTNSGPATATNVTLVDTLDSLVSFVSATSTQGTCSEASGVVTCDIGSLAESASATATIVVMTPDVMDNTVITNTASVSGSEPDPNTVNNTAIEETTIVPVLADLSVTKSDAPDPIFSGGPQITYSLTVSNNGPDGATNVMLTDTLPAGVSFDSVSSTAGSCQEASGVVTCDIGALANGASVDVTIIVTPEDVTDVTVITNSASVTATEQDPTPGNNSVTEDTTVNPPASDMRLSTGSTPSEPLINEQVTYSITVNNSGPSDNTGVVLTVVLPSNATFNSVAIDQGTCAVDMGTVTCTIGDMSAGVSVLAEIVVTAPGEATVLTLSATVVADVADPTPGNNATTQDVSVIDVINLVIQGTSEGTGSFGWIELLFLLAIAGVIAARAGRRQAAFSTTAALPALAGLLCALALTAPGEAKAENDWYLGISAGTTSLDYSASDLTRDLANLGWTISNADVDDSNNTWKYYAGFSFNEYWAIEAGWADLGEVITQYSTTIPPNQIDAILNDTLSIHPYQGDGWFAAGVAKWPLVPDQFSLVGRAGLFAWESDIEVRVIQGGTGRVTGDDSGTDGMFGVGFEWMINEEWSVTGDWERYKLNEWLDVPSIGIRYTFR